MTTSEFNDIDRYLIDKKGKIIHQVWFGTIPNKRAAKETYKKFKIYRDSWKNKNPEWFHMEWSKEMSDKIVRIFFPKYYDMYKEYPYEIQRCDLVRYFILYRYGGLYVDMDYYCNKPWDEAMYIFKNDFYLVSTPNNGGNYVSNSLMYSKPNHVFWKRLLKMMEKNRNFPIYYTRHMIIMYSTGPGILTRVFDKNKVNLNLASLPSNLFHPYGISDEILSLKNDDIFATHIGKGSWEKNDSKLLIHFYTEWRIILFIIISFLFPICYCIYSQRPITKNMSQNHRNNDS